MAVRIDGAKVKELREARVLERAELAALAGIGYTTVYKIEAHDHTPRLGTIRKIAKALKVKPDEILVRDRQTAAV